MGHRPLQRKNVITQQKEHDARIEQVERRWVETLGKAVLHIKVFPDTEVVTTGDQKFEFKISHDMDGMVLTDVETFVTTVSSSGLVTIQLRKRGQSGATIDDMLSTKCSIDANEFNSQTAATPFVIDPAESGVVDTYHVSIDVDAAGSGAKGLGVILTFEEPEP